MHVKHPINSSMLLGYGARGPSTDLRHGLRVFLEKIRSDTGIPGIGVALSVAGHPCSVAVGTATVDSSVALSTDSRFQLGCITKWLTAIVVAQLAAKGALDCEQQVHAYLPELFAQNRPRDVAIWHLMSHTSGYRGLNLGDAEVAHSYSWSMFAEMFRNSVPLFKPGTVFNYGHMEHVILGEIVQRVTGESALQLIKDLLLRPLEVDVGTVLDDHRNPRACVSEHVRNPLDSKFYALRPTVFCDFWHASLSPLTVNLPDLVRLGEAIMGMEHRRPDRHELPLRRAMQLALKQVITIPNTYGGPFSEQVPKAFGLGCAAFEGWILGRSGSGRGQTCSLRIDPQRLAVLAVGINAWDPHLRDAISERIFEALRGGSISRAPYPPMELALEDFAGRYLGVPGQSAEVSVDPTHVQCRLSDATSEQLPRTVRLERTPSGHLAVHAETEHHSFGFFRDPGTDAPCLMVGLQVFKRE